MNLAINAANINTFSNKALITIKDQLQSHYVSMTSTYLRHGWAGGFETYTADKAYLAQAIQLITDELKRRWKADRDLEQSLDQARAEVRAALVGAA